jgi:hypothetical protein
MTQALKNKEDVGAGCPMQIERSRGAADQQDLVELVRTSEVARTDPTDSALADVLEWMHDFLSQPHPELGRKGAVCPFVPVALEKDSIRMAQIVDPDPSADSVVATIRRFRDLFLATEPIRGPEAINKAFVVVFPNLSADSASLVDEVQGRLKEEFIDCGLMLGEFHMTSKKSGLRNAEFRPLRSPLPMLGMRQMVDSDLPFLDSADYPPEQRSSFLRSYLFRLGGSLSMARFDQAMDGLITAELEKGGLAGTSGALRQ